MKHRLIVVFLVLLSSAVGVAASVPPMINYQGKLMQPSGAPVPDGTYSMMFAIYDVPTGGTALWSETNPSVQVKGGLFATMLGSVVNLPSNIFDNPNRFFGVKVGDDPEMTPRQQIASVGFAVKAASADIATTVPDGAITTEKLAELGVTNAKIAADAVDAAKIAAAAVTASKIADGSVSASKLADGAVTGAKIEVQQGWIAPTLINGWSNWGGNDSTAAYFKDSLGVVHLKGTLTNGSGVCFVLPPGYRPQEWRYFATVADNVLGRVRIKSDGSVDLFIGSNVYFNLDGITFRAEQ